MGLQFPKCQNNSVVVLHYAFQKVRGESAPSDGPEGAGVGLPGQGGAPGAAQDGVAGPGQRGSVYM